VGADANKGNELKMTSAMEGRVVLVTGGGSGIGRAAALAFARAGARVVVADVAASGGSDTVEMIAASRGEAIFVQADVSRIDEVEAAVRETVQAFGRLDYAFNNAGIAGTRALTADYPIDAWLQVLEVNLTGVWLCMRSEIPQMLQQGAGAIVNTASVLSLTGEPGNCAYVAAKHGVAGLTKAAALEYSSRGIRVNAVCPAYIETPMISRLSMSHNPQEYIKVLERHPIGRLGKPEEVAEGVVWLCSEAASFVTGALIAIDGGYLAW
jgi:NAD(P)-dependent dehydrogenase (short-subunit alcohol dehydrogenase family)